MDIKKLYTLIPSQEFIEKLNEFLDSENFDDTQFEMLINSIKEWYNVKIKLFDFEYYNEARLEEAQKEKNICVEKLYFEKAAANRDLENECQKYIELKKQFKIKESMFFLELEYLFYFYFGNAKNDAAIKMIIQEFSYLQS